MHDEKIVSNKTFITAWAILMVLTFALIGISTSTGLTSVTKIFLILGMMIVQAYLVSFYFMHLRFEKLPLILNVVLGVIVTTLLLLALILWDGSRIVHTSWH